MMGNQHYLHPEQKKYPLTSIIEKANGHLRKVQPVYPEGTNL
jgi:hypothetical protein